MSKANIHKRDLALAFIVMFVDKTCQMVMQQIRRSAEAWRTLKDIFQAVSEAELNQKFCQFQATSLREGGGIIAD